MICPDEVRPVAPVIDPALVIPPDETLSEVRVPDVPDIAPAVSDDEPMLTVSVSVVNPRTVPFLLHPEMV